MAIKIAIASGKGGTGKTSVSVNLYHYLVNSTSNKVLLVDCDVEEPNDKIFFNNLICEKTEIKHQLIPQIDISKCTYCKKCEEYCEFNAIQIWPRMNYVNITDTLCHSCGACLVACGNYAISEHKSSIGVVSYYKTEYNTEILEGQLQIGSTMQTMMIKELKNCISPEYDIILLDSPPGTSCPVVETISDSDYVILVTEPTPFGLYDLQITVELLKEIQIPFGVIVNKANVGSNQIYDYLKKENIELIGEIPFMKEYAYNYANGELFHKIPEAISKSYQNIIEKLNPIFN